MKLEKCSPNMKHINTLNKFESAFCFKLFTSNASRVILKVVDFIDSVICNFTIMRIVNNVFTAFEIIQVAISDMVIDSIFCHRYCQTRGQTISRSSLDVSRSSPTQSLSQIQEVWT